MDDLLDELHSIEKSLQRRDFLETADAIIAASSNGPNATLGGLERLLAAIQSVLNRAAGKEVTILREQRQEVQECQGIVSFHSSSSSSSSSSSPIDRDNAPSALTGFIPEAAIMNAEDVKTWQSWDNNVDAETGISGPRNARSEIVTRLQRQAQALKQTLRSVIATTGQLSDAKLIASDLVFRCLHMYSNLLVDLIFEVEDKGSGSPLSAGTAVMSPVVLSTSSSSSILSAVGRLVYRSSDSVRNHPFFSDSAVKTVNDEAVAVWASAFSHDRTELARRDLYRQESKTSTVKHYLTNKQFLVKIGAGFVLLLWAFSECFNNELLGRKIWNDPSFSIFVCFGDLLLLLWMWGVSIFVWRVSGIDFVSLLHLQETEFATQPHPESLVFSAVTDLSLIFLAVFVVFNKAVRGWLDISSPLAVAHLIPLFLVLFFIFRMTQPSNRRARWWMMLWQVVAAPLYPVVFRDGYIGDLLTSLVRVFIPMAYSAIYFVHTLFAGLGGDLTVLSSTHHPEWEKGWVFNRCLVPLLTLLPLWIRLVQCLRRSVESGQRWPHMGNATKYTSAIIVISLGTFHPDVRHNTLWIAAFVFATLFQFTWDVTMDWGIVVWSTHKSASAIHQFGGLALREPRLLGPLWIYAAIMVGNIVLRFAWTLTLLPANRSYGVISLVLVHLSTFIAAAEVLRRMVWGFLRLEFEHLEVFGYSEKDPHDSTKSFEKMTIKLSESNDGSVGGKLGATLPVSVASALPEWTTPAWLRSFLYTQFQLDISGVRNRARLWEALGFASAVLMFVLAAAYMAPVEF